MTLIRAQAGVKNNIRKLNMSIIRSGNNHIMHVVLFALVCFFILYMWSKMFKRWETQDCTSFTLKKNLDECWKVVEISSSKQHFLVLLVPCYIERLFWTVTWSQNWVTEPQEMRLFPSNSIYEPSGLVRFTFLNTRMLDQDFGLVSIRTFRMFGK